jgi:hypothetical protein
MIPFNYFPPYHVILRILFSLILCDPLLK